MPLDAHKKVYAPEIVFGALLYGRGADLLAISGRLIERDKSDHTYLVTQAERHIAELVTGLAAYKAALGLKDGGSDAQ